MGIDLTAFAPRRVLEHDLLAGDRVLSRPATVLFVDLEGFTDLTGRLGEHGSRGTEQLSGLLRSFFGAVTDAVSALGGDPIGFGGDALTFVFDGPADDVLDPVRSSGEAIHRIAQELSGAATLAGPVALRTRIGIARGTVTTAVARALGRAVPVHLGPGLDLAEAAQSVAGAGQVVVDPSAVSGASDFPADVRRAVPTPDRLAELISPWVLDRLDADPVSHRQVSAAFVRFPPLASDGADVAEMARFTEVVGGLLAVVTEWEGEVVQVSGGDKGVVGLVVYGAPLAHADDPARAAEAVLRLREQVPDVSAGVATGPVFAALLGSRTRVFPTHFGLSVTTAARLMQAAEPGQILVDPGTWAGARGALRSHGRPRALALKGHEQPVEAHAVEGRRGAERAAGAASLPPLVGRRGELVAIEDLLDRTGRGDAAVVTLVGEPGLGKTRLLEEAIERARTRGFTVVRADVDALGRGQALWRDLLGQAGDPALADPALRPLLGSGHGEESGVLGVDPELDAELAGAALAKALSERAADGPLLVAIDDVHRLDEFSAAVLSGFASAATGSLGLLLTRAGGSGTGQVQVGELTPAEAAQVATDAWRMAGGGSAPGWLGAMVAERAGANPLFVRTVTQALHTSWQPGSPPPMLADDEAQPTLTGLLRERVDRQPRLDQELLAALAVLDTPSALDTIGAVLPRPREPAEVAASAARLSEHQLVEVVAGPEGERYRLRHRVLRDVVHAGLSHADRDQAHRAVVEALTAADADPVEVAEHVRHLDDADQVRRWFPPAAESARRSWNFPQAASYLEAVRPLVSGDDRARLDVEHLEVLLVAGRAPDVLTLETQIVETGDPLLRIRRLLAVAEAAFSCGDLERTQEVGRELMRLADGTDEPRYQRAAELTVLATAASGAGEAAVEDAEALVRRAARSSDPRPVATARAALGAALLMSGRADDAVPHYRAALQGARDAGDVLSQVHVLSDLAGCAYEGDDQDECVRLLSEARAIADRIGYRRHLVVSLTNEALLRAAMGDPYAGACAEVAVERSLELGDLATAASALEAWLSGEPDLAAEPDWWRRLVALDRDLGRPEADHLAEEAVATARRGAVEDARATAEVTAPDEPATARRIALARALTSGTDEKRLAALDRLASETAEAEDADPRELAEVAVERWRVTRTVESREVARSLLDRAFAEEPSRLLRLWYDELGVTPPEAPPALPSPVGIDAVLGADAQERLERAFAAVEDAMRARQRSEKNTET